MWASLPTEISKGSASYTYCSPRPRSMTAIHTLHGLRRNNRYDQTCSRQEIGIRPPNNKAQKFGILGIRNNVSSLQASPQDLTVYQLDLTKFRQNLFGQP